MARKDPFLTVRIRRSILELLRPLLEAENKSQFRPYSMNAFCEKILWDYANGRVGYLGKDALEQMQRMVRGVKEPLDPIVGASVERFEVRDQPAGESELKSEDRKRVHKRTRHVG